MQVTEIGQVPCYWHQGCLITHPLLTMGAVTLPGISAKPSAGGAFIHALTLRSPQPIMDARCWIPTSLSWPLRLTKGHIPLSPGAPHSRYSAQQHTRPLQTSFPSVTHFSASLLVFSGLLNTSLALASSLWGLYLGEPKLRHI